MAPQKITEQQFRTRRRDRKMVWVDAAAAAIGLLLLVASVGGVIVLEEEPGPTEFTVNWFEGKNTEKFCRACEPNRVGGTSLDLRPAPEGKNIQVGGFTDVTMANVTRVVFTLDWFDDQPLDNDGQNYKYDYTNESTDLLRLSVMTPWGENVTIEGANAMPKSAGDKAAGTLQVQWNFSSIPEVKKVKAFSIEDAQEQLMGNHTVVAYDAYEHSPLGEWRAVVKVVRAGDQNGTVPADACQNGYVQAPPEVRETLPGADGPRDLQATYDATCDTQPEQKQNDPKVPLKDSPQGEPLYRSTYVDEGNSWILQRNVWAYSSQVSY